MRHKIQLLDTHAGGDVSRIVIGGIKEIPGKSVCQKMEYLRKNVDGLRKTLLFEPYGVPEMSIDLLVPASNKDAVAGYIIMEVMGYPIYSGSNTICTATAVIEEGIVPKKEGKLNFKLESPAGLVDIEAMVEKGVVESITCKGLPSYIERYKEVINVPTIGKVTFSIAYSGGFYALVEAKDFDFKLTIGEEVKLNEIAYKIVEQINKQFKFKHYSLGDVGKLPFLHFMGEVEKKAEGLYSSRSTTYVHPGVICRSTTGTGTSARLAFLNYENKIKSADKLETVSLRETKFIGEFVSEEIIHGHKVVNNKITGKSYILAKSDIFINSNDSMVDCNDLSLLTKES
jgi:proline racemase